MNISSDAERRDHFFNVYNRDTPAYGEIPSSELHQLLSQCFPLPDAHSRKADDPSAGNSPDNAAPATRRALDLGCGPGRDSMALARHGFAVTSVDLSSRGLEELQRRADTNPLSGSIETVCNDVRQLKIPPNEFDVISATTILDHIPSDDVQPLWDQIVSGLKEHGFLFVEVHTTDDPGCVKCTSQTRDAPVSETAQWVINHFARGQLLQLAMATPTLRILRYEERYEWDYTHGPEHKHAKAVLLATQKNHDPAWYGHPLAFPRTRPNRTDNPAY